MSNELETRIAGELEQFKRDKVYKTLNYLDSPQGPESPWKAGERWSCCRPTIISG